MRYLQDMESSTSEVGFADVPGVNVDILRQTYCIELRYRNSGTRAITLIKLQQFEIKR